MFRLLKCEVSSPAAYIWVWCRLFRNGWKYIIISFIMQYEHLLYEIIIENTLREISRLVKCAFSSLAAKQPKCRVRGRVFQNGMKYIKITLILQYERLLCEINIENTNFVKFSGCWNVKLPAQQPRSLNLSLMAGVSERQKIHHNHFYFAIRAFIVWNLHQKH